MMEQTENTAEKSKAGCCETTKSSAHAWKCPMTEMCQGTMTGVKFAIVFLIVGSLLMLAGILILVEPRLLAWLLGCGAIVLGVLMISAPLFLRKFSTCMQSAQPKDEAGKT